MGCSIILDVSSSQQSPQLYGIACSSSIASGIGCLPRLPRVQPATTFLPSLLLLPPSSIVCIKVKHLEASAELPRTTNTLTFSCNLQLFLLQTFSYTTHSQRPNTDPSTHSLLISSAQRTPCFLQSFQAYCTHHVFLCSHSICSIFQGSWLWPRSLP